MGEKATLAPLPHEPQASYLLAGPTGRFAGTIRASGHERAASTGRTQDCTRTSRQNINPPLAMRKPSTKDIRDSVDVAQTNSMARTECNLVKAYGGAHARRRIYPGARQHRAGPRPH